VIKEVIAKRPRAIKRKRDNSFDPRKFIVYYDPRIHPLVAEYMARDGCSEVEIATKIGITKITFERWKTKYQAFKEALACNGMAVNEQVTKALLSRCLGYEYEEREVHLKYLPNPVDRTKMIQVVDKERVTTKRMAPDPQSCFFWLTNKDRAIWQSMGALASLAIQKKDGELAPEQIAALLQASASAINDSVLGYDPTLH
jgi:hypothetical protein